MSGINEVFLEFWLFFTAISWRKWMTRLIMVIALFALVFGGFSYLNETFGLEDDNPLEQAVEDIIERKTGIEIDLTPETKLPERAVLS